MIDKRLGFFILFAAVGTWATWPSVDSIKLTTCDPDGVLARLSSVIYQSGFWRIQLEDVRRRAARAENWDTDQEQMRRKIDSTLDAARQRLENIYQKHPNLAPSPAQQAADQLRKEADDIERLEGTRMLSEFNQKKLVMLRRCEAKIAMMLRGQ